MCNRLSILFRRRRINTCLEQLRSLLPFTTTMKRDMASLLEQTVEYINTMHTVLNEEEPACLSKIYTVYQQKLEEHDFFKKSVKGNKRRLASSGSSSTVDTQPPSPLMDQHPGFVPTSGQSCVEEANKRCCLSTDKDSNCAEFHPDLMSFQTAVLPPGQPVQVLEPVHDFNGNCVHYFPGLPYGSSMNGGCRQVPCTSNAYESGQECILTNHDEPYAIYHSGGDRPQQSLVNHYPKPKLCAGMSARFVAGNSPFISSPTIGKITGAVPPEMIISCSGNQWSNVVRTTDAATAGQKTQPKFSIASLVYKDNGVENVRSSSVLTDSLEQQREIKTDEFAVTTETALRTNNPAQQFLAPVEMSPSSNGRMESPRFVGVNKLLGTADKSDMLRGLSYGGRDMGLLLRASSVSNMLNDVSTPSDGVPRGSFGSTEKKMTPLLGWLRTPCPIEIAEVTSNADPTSVSTSMVSLKTADGESKSTRTNVPELIQTPDLKSDESSDSTDNEA